MTLSIIDIVMLFGSVQGFFLAILIFNKNRQNKANILLAILILAYALFLINIILIRAGFLEQNPLWVISLDGLPLVFGPLHYLYARFLTARDRSFNWKHGLHFVPFLIFRLYFSDAYFADMESLLGSIQKMNQSKPLVFIITGWVIAIQGLVYMYLTLKIIKKYEAEIRSVYSSISRINLNWLRNITFMTLAVWIVVFIENLLLNLGSSLLGVETELVGMLTAIIVYIMGYMGFARSAVFEQVSHSISSDAIINDVSDPSESSEKYLKSGLSEEKAREYKNTLIEKVEKQELYKKSDLTLQEIAENLNISVHNLSQVINTQIGQNFFDFINKYRIEAVKEKLTDPAYDHLKILAIAFDCGFNSKTSFNNIFKKFTGETPSDFRSRLKEK